MLPLFVINDSDNNLLIIKGELSRSRQRMRRHGIPVHTFSSFCFLGTPESALTGQAFSSVIFSGQMSGYVHY